MVYSTLYDLQTGVNIDINGKVHHLLGTVLAVLADTVAAHQLGGFKIGVGFSLRKCRHCMATSDDMQTKVYNHKILTTLYIKPVYTCMPII